jgi:hypothetical protein
MPSAIPGYKILGFGIYTFCLKGKEPFNSTGSFLDLKTRLIHLKFSIFKKFIIE